MKLSSDSTWSFDSASSNSVFSSIGWNQTAGISKSASVYHDESEHGSCSELVASGTSTYIQIYTIQGTKLDFEASACAYSGDQVKYISHRKEILSYDSYTHSIYTHDLGSYEMDLLHIAGVRSTDISVIDLCVKAMEELGYQFMRNTSKKINIKTKYRKSPNTHHLQ